MCVMTTCTVRSELAYMYTITGCIPLYTRTGRPLLDDT